MYPIVSSGLKAAVTIGVCSFRPQEATQEEI